MVDVETKGYNTPGGNNMCTGASVSVYTACSNDSDAAVQL